MLNDSNPVADIAIIGSGLACTYTLIALFEKLLSDNTNPQKPVQITVIERYKEMWKGIPYGDRSSVNALTITTLQDFFTSDNERADFFEWFLPRKTEMLNTYIKLGGTTADKWYKNNQQALFNNNWDDVYFPRFIIGDYILQKLNALRQQVEIKKLASIKTITGNATAIKQKGIIKKVVVYQGGLAINVLAKKIVLAIGSAPIKKLTDAFDNQSRVLYINDLHQENSEETISSIYTSLDSATCEDKNILVVGSNADCIELLYLLQTTDNLFDNISSITILSTGGKLPGHITYERYKHHITASLDALAEKVYHIEDLVNAAIQDIRAVLSDKVSVPDIDQIVSKTITMLEPLNVESKKLFYGVYGIQLARVFRRSGSDYKKASNTLLEINKLNLLKGDFGELIYYPNGTTTLIYENEDKTTSNFTKRFKVIINCTGSNTLLDSSSYLIKDLIENNGFKVNLSKRSFELTDDLEAIPGIYVIGPLAGGNFNKLLHFWHLENASRIIYLSKYLAKNLLNSF